MFLDVGSAATPEQAVVRKAALAFKRLLQDRGADLAYARRLPDLSRAHGLRDIAGEVVRHRWVGGVATGGGELLPGCRGDDRAESLQQRGTLRAGPARGPPLRCRDEPADLRQGTPTDLNHWARQASPQTDRVGALGFTTPHAPGRRRVLLCAAPKGGPEKRASDGRTCPSKARRSPRDSPSSHSTVRPTTRS